MRKTRYSLLEWGKWCSAGSSRGYIWRAVGGSHTYAVFPNGALLQRKGDSNSSHRVKYADASTARQKAEDHFAEHYPLLALALSSETE
jgi:hypothetical protein